MLKILKRAREILGDTENWIKGCYGLTSDGEELTCWQLMVGEEAKCLSVLGALHYDSESEYCAVREAEKSLENEILSSTPFLSIEAWNDHPKTTHDEILTILDRIIEKETQHEIQARNGAHYS